MDDALKHPSEWDTDRLRETLENAADDTGWDLTVVAEAAAERLRGLQEAVGVACVRWRERINGSEGGFTGFLHTPERQAWDEFRLRGDAKMEMLQVHHRAEHGSRLKAAIDTREDERV